MPTPLNLSLSLGPPLAEATALRPELRSGAGLEAEGLEAAHTVDEYNARWPQAQHEGISSSSLPHASVSKETIWQPPPPRSRLPPLQSPTRTPRSTAGPRPPASGSIKRQSSQHWHSLQLLFAVAPDSPGSPLPFPMVSVLPGWGAWACGGGGHPGLGQNPGRPEGSQHPQVHLP